MNLGSRRIAVSHLGIGVGIWVGIWAGLVVGIFVVGAMVGACGPRGATELTPAAAPSPADPPVLLGGEPEVDGADAVQKTEDPERAGEGAEAPRPGPVSRERPPPPTPADAGACPEPGAGDPSLGIMTSPIDPVVGEPLRIIAATLGSEEPLALRIEAEGAAAISADRTLRPGVPAAVIGSLIPEAPGTLTAIVGRRGVGLACAKIRVRRGAAARAPRPAEKAVWPVKRTWDAAEEALFSAWVRELFHAERGAELAYRALHEVTGDRTRNLLHDALGWGEDGDPKGGGLRLVPDCADAPYFLRAYFAWKRGLPFAFRKCSRGSPGKAPRCGAPITQESADPGSGQQPGELGAVQHFFRRTLAWGVHTGNGRVAHGDDASDLYPIRLDRRGLRPGTVYADPYGHILVLVELVDPEGSAPGILYAIDGQPDGSITRKRFWEGNFLWNADPALGGSGFKSFRPVVRRRDSEGVQELVQLSDREIAGASGYGDVSDEQASLDGVAFYDRMEALINPGTRDPRIAQAEAIAALAEAARVRVTSVDNGERYFAGGGKTIAMPEGFRIFETTGPWESFSTPARDLRLLVAIDVVQGFAAKVRRQPALFGIPPGAEQPGRLAVVIEGLDRERAQRLTDPEFRFQYTRSDGSTQELGLDELIARASALEVAYNPNDCPEIRWGAPSGSSEHRTCRRRAPSDQQAKMDRYRVWFRERRRPPRGTLEP